METREPRETRFHLHISTTTTTTNPARLSQSNESPWRPVRHVEMAAAGKKRTRHSPHSLPFIPKPAFHAAFSLNATCRLKVSVSRTKADFNFFHLEPAVSLKTELSFLRDRRWCKLSRMLIRPWRGMWRSSALQLKSAACVACEESPSGSRRDLLLPMRRGDGGDKPPKRPSNLPEISSVNFKM